MGPWCVDRLYVDRRPVVHTDQWRCGQVDRVHERAAKPKCPREPWQRLQFLPFKWPADQPL